MPRAGVGTALAGISIHAFVSVVLASAILTSAYAFGDDLPGSQDVGSVDQLYLLGDSPRFGYYGLFLSGLLDVITTATLLIVTRTRPWAWLAPFGFLALSLVVTALSIANFQPPPPGLGG